MENKYNVVHCFFEQSGTFKNEFIKLGFKSYDYDICNDFNETDFVIDLFNEINKAYDDFPSIFDNISKHDLIIAFFPCIRFSKQALMLYKCTNSSLMKLSDFDKIKASMKYHDELYNMFILFCKLILVCLSRNIKLVIENPYSSHHYLTRYFPVEPSIIDMNRRDDGDYFVKPTQFWFFNFVPFDNFIFEPIDFCEYRTVCNLPKGVVRSLISPTYVNRFIKRYLISHE